MTPKGKNGGKPSPPRSPSPLGPSRERGREEQRQRLALQRQPLPLVQYWRGGRSYADVGSGFALCLLGFGSAMEGPGLSFRGREASLVQPRVSVVTWQTSEEFSPEGVSTTSFSVWLDPLGGAGNTFSHCRRWVKGNLRGERRGRFFQGRNSPRFFGRVLYEERAA